MTFVRRVLRSIYQRLLRPIARRIVYALRPAAWRVLGAPPVAPLAMPCMPTLGSAAPGVPSDIEVLLDALVRELARLRVAVEDVGARLPDGPDPTPRPARTTVSACPNVLAENAGAER